MIIADICQCRRWCTFFKQVYENAKFWSIWANSGYFTANLHTFWCTLQVLKMWLKNRKKKKIVGRQMMIFLKVVKGRSENLVMVVLWRDKYSVMLARNERSPSSATLSLELTLDTIYSPIYSQIGNW